MTGATIPTKVPTGVRTELLRRDIAKGRCMADIQITLCHADRVLLNDDVIPDAEITCVFLAIRIQGKRYTDHTTDRQYWHSLEHGVTVWEHPARPGEPPEGWTNASSDG